MNLPSMLTAIVRSRWSSSCSSSSSLHCVSGFLAPPISVFFVTSLVIPSINFVRCDPPGGESKYCLTIMAANPLVPPKYSISVSSNSLECGMFAPPRAAAFVKALRAPDSMRAMSCLERFSFFPLLARARHIKHRASHVPSCFLRKWSVVCGKMPPQSVQVFSLI